MKNYAWIIMVAGLLTIPSCSSDSPEVNTPTENEKTEKEEKVTSITAVIPTIKDMSRAQVNPDSSATDEQSVYWNKGDQISLRIGQRTHLLNIDSSYDETKDGGSRTAKFMVSENITPSHYLALYPIDVQISGDTIIYDSSLKEMDFTSAHTPEEKAKVWRESMSRNMLLHAEGILKGGDETTINLQQKHSVLSFKYTNLSGKIRGIDALYVSGISFGPIWIKRSNPNELYGWGSTPSLLITKGLQIADKESMDFYFYFYPSKAYIQNEGGCLRFEYTDGLPVDHLYKERDLVYFPIETIKETYNIPNYLKEGQRYHFEVVETPTGLLWDTPESSVSVP